MVFYKSNSDVKYTESEKDKKLFAEHKKHAIGKLGEYDINDFDLIHNLQSPDSNSSPLVFTVTINAQNGNKLEVRAFADLGATHGSYTSEKKSGVASRKWDC